MMATVMLSVVVLFVLFTEKQETFWSYFDEGRYFCPFTVRILAALMLFFSPTNFFEASWLSTEKKTLKSGIFQKTNESDAVAHCSTHLKKYSELLWL